MGGRTGDGGSKARGHSSGIHQLLAMEPEQVKAELAARGKTPKDVARAFGAMGRKLAGAFPDVAGADLSLEPASRRRLEFAPADPAAHGAARRLNDAAQHPASFEPAWDSKPWANAKMVLCADMDLHTQEVGDPPFDLVVFDPDSEPKDGDVVLAWLPTTGRGLRRLRQTGPDEVSLEALGGGLGEREVGHPSNFVIHGVALALARKI